MSWWLGYGSMIQRPDQVTRVWLWDAATTWVYLLSSRWRQNHSRPILNVGSSKLHEQTEVNVDNLFNLMQAALTTKRCIQSETIDRIRQRVSRFLNIMCLVFGNPLWHCRLTGTGVITVCTVCHEYSVTDHNSVQWVVHERKNIGCTYWVTLRKQLIVTVRCPQIVTIEIPTLIHGMIAGCLALHLWRSSSDKTTVH